MTQQQKAHAAVASAIRAGDLPPAASQQCADCGSPAVHYDHRDYRLELKVDPVCRACNFRRGPGEGKTAESDDMVRSRAFLVRASERDLKRYHRKARAHGYKEFSPFVRHLLDIAPDRPKSSADRDSEAA